MFKAHCAFFFTLLFKVEGPRLWLPLRWWSGLSPGGLPSPHQAPRPVYEESTFVARLEFTATTEQPFLKDKQACFLILLIQNVSWELDFRVEYNYSFLSDLTLHSWEPNLVEKTKFRVVLLDVMSERFVYEICWKCAALVFSCQTAEAQVHLAALPEPNNRGSVAESR